MTNLGGIMAFLQNLLNKINLISKKQPTTNHGKLYDGNLTVNSYPNIIPKPENPPAAQPIIPMDELVIKIINVINDSKYPWNPNVKWGNRPKEKIEMISVHQAAGDSKVSGHNQYHITPTSDRNKDGKIDEWERNHLAASGAPHLCYHYVICHDKDDYPDGTIIQVNPITNVTWAVKGYNTKAVNILVNGNFRGNGWEKQGTHDPTVKQIKSLKLLLDKLTNDLRISKTKIFGHCELANYKPACPGYKVMEFINSYRNT